MKCPHKGCKGQIDTDLIVLHASSYGGSISLVECPKCLRGVKIGSTIKISLSSDIYTGPETTGTWGGTIPAYPVVEKPNPMGYCPHCKSKTHRMERRMNGNSTCENGHIYPSYASLKTKD